MKKLKTIKAVIPVAGIGSHLRPHTHTQPKGLIPVAGKPIISHIIDNLEKHEIKNFVFIIGHLGEQIKEFIENNYPQLNCSFIVQSQRLGIAHAIWTAKNEIENEDELIIALGDTIFDMDIKSFLSSPYSCLGTKKVSDPRNFGVAEIKNNDSIVSLVEKPAIPKSNIALVGVYKIKEVKQFISSLQHIIDEKILTKNEFQLTDALMYMISEYNIHFKSYKVDDWFDCGQKEVLLETNAILLKRPEFATKKKFNFKNTIIIQPVNIADNCSISNSIIGPNVTIGENASISYSIVKESIIGNYANLKNAVLNDSIIGNDSILKGSMQSLNLGDSTEINYE